MPDTVVLKEAEYRNFNQGTSRVVYARLPGNRIVFSGITPPHNRTSTVNAAGGIVRVIAEAEGIDPSQFLFYDLQTSLGYGRAKAPTGKLAFSQLNIEWGVRPYFVSGWIGETCSEDVIRVFAEQIGHPPRQVRDAFDL